MYTFIYVYTYIYIYRGGDTTVKKCGAAKPPRWTLYHESTLCG